MSAPTCPVCGSARVEPYPTPFADPVVRCRGCGTRFVHPVPPAAALRARYEAEHRAGKWGELFGASDPMVPPRRVRLLDGLDPGRGSGRLLDVGCGDGRFLDAAAAAGWRPVGLELSHGVVRALGNRHPVLVGSLAALRAGPRFAAITFWDVLEHLPDPAAALGAAARLLEPRGLLAVSLPSASGTEALVRGAGWRFHDLPAYGHLVHLGPSQLRRLLVSAGLEVVHREDAWLGGSAGLARSRCPPWRAPAAGLVPRPVERRAGPGGRAHSFRQHAPDGGAPVGRVGVATR